MKKILFFGILLVVLFVTCKKDSTTYQSYFWTSIDSSSVKLNIYIDGKMVGVVQYLSKSPDFYNDSLLQNLTPVPLTIGTYEFQAKDEVGNIRCSALVSIKNVGTSATHIHGQLDIHGDDDYLLFGMSD